MENVKQGSAAIGLQSKTHVVMAYVNKANSELSSHQKKIFKVDDHIGVAIAGLTADGRVLSRYMRSECINYNYTYEPPLPVGRLVVQLADKAQEVLFCKDRMADHSTFANPSCFHIACCIKRYHGFARGHCTDRIELRFHFCCCCVHYIRIVRGWSLGLGNQ